MDPIVFVWMGGKLRLFLYTLAVSRLLCMMDDFLTKLKDKGNLNPILCRQIKLLFWESLLH